MAATREQVMNALLALLAGTANFQLTGRRNPRPETLGPSVSPALFLLGETESYKRPAPQLPPERTLRVSAMIYNDIGQAENLIPETPINNALDNLDAALKAVDPITGRFTLGGLVYSLMIEGEVRKASGEKTGKAAAIVPFAIIMP